MDSCLENFGCQHDSGRGETQVGFAHCQGDHENTKPKPHVMSVMSAMRHVKLDMCDSQVCSTACGWYLYAISLRKNNWLLHFVAIYKTGIDPLQAFGVAIVIKFKVVPHCTLCILLSQAVLPCQCFHQWHLPLVSMHCCKRGSNTFPLSLNLDGCRVHENKL